MCLLSRTAVAALLVATMARAGAGTAEDLKGVESTYTPWLIELLRDWPQRAPSPTEALTLTCLETPGRPVYVGLLQTMTVNADVDRVAAVLEDFAHYSELVPDVADVHIVKGSQEGHRFVASFEQKMPFFLPNLRYEMAYLVERARPERVTYRYQLKTSKDMTANDGAIVLERDGGKTRYVEYDFVEMPMALVSSDQMWRASVESAYRGDLAVMLRAENPTWSSGRLRQEIDARASHYATAPCVKHRRSPQ
jgi:hypothetical protein